MACNRTYSIKNQERLRAYLRKIEIDDTKASDRHNPKIGRSARNDRNDLERGCNGSPRVERR